MIPLRDVILSRTMPYVTVTIITLNTLVFFVELSLSVPDRSRFIEVYGVVPASVGSLSLLTSMFLHGGWLHLLGNMLYLWIFGDNVEDRVGHGHFVVFYVMCGLAAAIVQIASNPDSVVPMVGASGAIAGVMGAYFVLFPRSRVLTLLPHVHRVGADRSSRDFLPWLLAPPAPERYRVGRCGTRHRRHCLLGAHRRVRHGRGRDLLLPPAGASAAPMVGTTRVLGASCCMPRAVPSS